MRTKQSFLARLGVYGFEAVELVILSALVTEDPLLLIGNSGTGKTFLLNSISEALGLEHRHYNASLISFDDLVGFPYPDEDKSCVKFLETPATVWGAESVLVDEISRCKPEHQNRLFSLVHERRIQGISLEKLRFRWAAMNPCSADHGNEYGGSEALDQALADRFGLIVRVGDWRDLSLANRKLVADPSGDGVVANDGGALATALLQWQLRYREALPHCPSQIIDYACAAVSHLGEARIRISPRRARMLSRSLLAATVVSGRAPNSSLFKLVLECSLPQHAWGEEPRAAAVAAAHQAAWDLSFSTKDERWIHEFHAQPTLAGKAKMLFNGCPSPDTGSSAVAQMLVSDGDVRATTLAMALYPAAAAGLVPGLGAEGISDLGRVAQPVLSVNGKVSWREPLTEKGTSHPKVAECANVLKRLDGARRERAEQLFNHLIVNNSFLHNPAQVERELDDCVVAIAGEVNR